MGDDSRNNNLEIEVDENWTIEQILDEIIRINYLPRISGGKATWSVAYYNPLAVIAQEWEKPIFFNRQFPFSKPNESKDFDRLHFNYHAQYDPDIVKTVLGRFKTIYFFKE